MSTFPCLVRFVPGSGQVRYRLGDRLVDRYLKFVAGRCRPNTLRAVAFDLKAFFTVIPKDPVAGLGSGDWLIGRARAQVPHQCLGWSSEIQGACSSTVRRVA